MDAKPRRRYLPRFSLRTLLILVLLAASGFGLWWRWEPWIVQWSSGEDLARGSLQGFSPDGEVVLSTPRFNKLSVWNARDGKKALDIDPDPLTTVFTLRPGPFSTCGGYIYKTGRITRPTLVWNIRDGKRVEFSKEGKLEEVLGIADDLVVLRSLDEFNRKSLRNSVRCVDLKMQKEVFQKEGLSFCLERRGEALAILSDERNVEIYRLPGCERLVKIENIEPTETIVAFDWAASRIILQNNKYILEVYDLKNRSKVATIDSGRLDFTSSLSPDGSILRVPSYNGTKNSFYETQGGKLLWSTDDSNVEGYNISFSPDSRTLAITKFDGHSVNSEWTRILDSRAGSVLAELTPADGQYSKAVFSPTEMRILAEESDGTLTMWELRRPEQWWGLAWLPEFWLTVVFGIALIWSLRRDWKTLRGRRVCVEPEKAVAP